MIDTLNADRFQFRAQLDNRTLNLRKMMKKSISVEILAFGPDIPYVTKFCFN